MYCAKGCDEWKKCDLSELFDTFTILACYLPGQEGFMVFKAIKDQPLWCYIEKKVSHSAVSEKSQQGDLRNKFNCS